MRGEPERALERYLPAIRLALRTEATPRLLQVLPGYADALTRCGDEDASGRHLARPGHHPHAAIGAGEGAEDAGSEEWSEDLRLSQLLLDSLRPRLTLTDAY